MQASLKRPGTTMDVLHCSRSVSASTAWLNSVRSHDEAAGARVEHEPFVCNQQHASCAMLMLLKDVMEEDADGLVEDNAR